MMKLCTRTTMTYSCCRLATAMSVFGIRMAVRYKFVILGFILGLVLMIIMSVPYDSGNKSMGNLGEYISNALYNVKLLGITISLTTSFNNTLVLVQDQNVLQTRDTVKSLRTIMSKDIAEVMMEAQKEKEMVGEILNKEGGERDLLALGQQLGKFGEHSELHDARNKIKSLEEMINNLEQRKKELSLNGNKKKKKSKKKRKKTKQEPNPTPLSINNGSLSLNTIFEKVR